MSTPAARFIRVSGDTQDERSQIADCDRAAEREGLEFALPDFQLHAVSGSKGDKRHLSALDAALQAIRAGLITVIVVAHSSRLSRLDPREAQMFRLQVGMAGGRIVSHDEPNLGRDDIVGDIVTLLAERDNHEYSKTLSGHIRRKFRNEVDANNGFRGVAPTGYAITGEKYRKQLTPSDGVCRCANAKNAPKYHKRCLISAQMVREAIADCGTGTSTVTLGKRLGMTPDAVAKMIRNPTYSTGRYEIRHRDGSGVYVYRCEPLVKPEVQKAAIAALEARRTGDNVASRAIAKEDFSGAVWCGHCDGRMYRYFGGGRKRADGTTGPKVRRYKCENCPKSVKADEADKAVNDLMSADDSWWMRSRLIPGDDHSAELARAQDELDSLGARRLPRAEMLAETTRLYDEIDRLEALPSTPARTVYERARDDNGRVISEGEHWGLMTMPERREWLLSRAAVTHYPTVKSAPGRTGVVIADVAYLPADEDRAEAAA
jgi:hypothetical protein